MSDVLSTGAAWLSSQLKAKAGTSITYRRKNGGSVTVTATIGQTTHDTAGDFGTILTWQSRDYLINVADLVVNGQTITPQRGDKIVETAGSVEHTYEVMGDNDLPAWRFSGPYRNKFRIHTKQINLA